MEHLLIRKNPWIGERCCDNDCIVCRQEPGRLCKHICLLCKQNGKNDVYFGHTSRSMLEHANKHDQEIKDRTNKSHFLKHIEEHHPSLLLDQEGNHDDLTRMFRWEKHQSCRTCYERGILEEVVIKL